MDCIVASVVWHDGFPLPRSDAKRDEVVAWRKAADEGGLNDDGRPCLAERLEPLCVQGFRVGAVDGDAFFGFHGEPENRTNPLCEEPGRHAQADGLSAGNADGIRFALGGQMEVEDDAASLAFRGVVADVRAVFGEAKQSESPGPPSLLRREPESASRRRVRDRNRIHVAAWRARRSPRLSAVEKERMVVRHDLLAGVRPAGCWFRLS